MVFRIAFTLSGVLKNKILKSPNSDSNLLLELKQTTICHEALKAITSLILNFHN